MPRFHTAPNSLKRLGVLFLWSRVGRLLAPVASSLLPAIYFLKYARWFHEQHVPTLLLPTRQSFDYKNRYELYGALSNDLSLATERILYLEFGVASGDSFIWWASHNTNPGSRFVGFDTFEGLPENWGRLAAGTFGTGGVLPEITDTRTSFERGLFQQTLPAFLRQLSFTEARNVIHLDADLYSSTLFVLFALSPLLKRDDILIFDEFADGMNEFRALLDASSCLSLHLKPLVAVNGGNQIAFAVQ